MLQLTEGGYKKRGSIAVSKIDASGFYYLNVEGEPGHAIKCILQASDDWDIMVVCDCSAVDYW